jgi:hypothetical protein
MRTIEFLENKGFRHIQHLHQKRLGKTVDFAACRGNVTYAIEVTRVGLPQSDKKQSIFVDEVRKRISVGSSEQDFFIGLIGAEDTFPTFERVIGDAINAKYPQVKQFCQLQNETYKGIIVISFGRDYFVTEHSRNDLNWYPNDIQKTIQKIYQEQRNTLEYMNHIVVLPGKHLDKALTYPALSDN